MNSPAGRLEEFDPGLHGAVLLLDLLCGLRARARADQLPEELQVLDGRPQRAQATESTEDHDFFLTKKYFC